MTSAHQNHLTFAQINLMLSHSVECIIKSRPREQIFATWHHHKCWIDLMVQTEQKSGDSGALKSCNPDPIDTEIAVIM